MSFPKINRPDEMVLFSSRVGSSRYKLSEHALRFVVKGDVSISDIEYSLKKGVVIEERCNSERGTTYLIGADHKNKFIHIVCAEELGEWTYVLFAYVPKLPIWESPFLRTQVEVLPMNDDRVVVGNCYFCSGDLVAITMGNYDYRKDGRLYTLKKVPANICKQCGEKYLLPETGRCINLLIADTFSMEVEESTVIEYHASEFVS